MMKALKRAFCLAGLLAATPAAAAPCVLDTLELDRMQESLTVELDRNQVSAGQEVTLTWHTERAAARFPVYLVVSFDQPVELEGKHVTALNPGSRGPFGMAWNQDRTRALVPLFQGTNGQGRLAIRLVEDDSVGIEWSVVGKVGTCPSRQALRGAPKISTLYEAAS